LTKCKTAIFIFSGNVKLPTSNDPLKALAKNCEPQYGANFAGNIVDVFSTALADEGKVETADLILRNGFLFLKKANLLVIVLKRVKNQKSG